MEAAPAPKPLLGRLVLEKGLVTEDELEAALIEQELTGRRLG